jgi:hypothetical protein
MKKQWMLCASLSATIACSNQAGSRSDEERVASTRYAETLLGSGISAEVLLDDPVSTLLFEYAPGPLSISADPNGFMVSWLDARESRGINGLPENGALVVATRISNSGVVGHPSGLFLSSEDTWGWGTGGPGSAFNGQSHLIAWHRLRPPPTNPLEYNLAEPSEIVAMRISTTGEPIDAAPFLVNALPAGDASNIAAVLAKGSEFFVAWSGEKASAAPGSVQSRTLSFAGSEPVLSPITTYPVSGGDPSKYAFIFDGVSYVAAFVNAGNTGFTIGGLTHAAGSDCPAVASPSIDAVTLASNGAGEILVAYRGRVVPQNGPCKVGTKAVLIGADGLEKAPPISLGASSAPPVVSYINGKYFVAGFEIDPLTNTASRVTNSVPSPVACNASTCLGAVGGTALSRVSSTGLALDDPPIRIGTPAREQNEPIVTAGAGKYLAAWYEQSGDYDRVIHAGRLDSDGTSLDPNPMSIAGTNTFIKDVGFNGTDFLVAWLTQLPTNDWSVRVTRISPDGTLKDPNGIELAGVGGDMVMACATTECLLAWSSATLGVVSVARLASDGSLVDSPPLQILSKASPSMLAYADGGYVLQYLTSDFDEPIDSDHPGKFVLQKLDATGHLLGAPMPVPGLPQALQRCGSGYITRTFVLQGNTFTWFASLLDSNAQVVQEKLDLGGGITWEPISSASFANGCAIAWARRTDSWDIYGRLLSTDGGLTSPALPIAADAFNEFRPALAAGVDGNVLAVYRHFVARAPYGSFRIAARLIEPAAFALGTGGSGGSGGQANGTGGQLATGGTSNVAGSGGESSGSGGQPATGGTSNVAGAGGESGGNGGQPATGGTSNVAGSGEGMGGAVSTGGSASAGAGGVGATSGEGGDPGIGEGGGGGSAPAGGSLATAGTAQSGGGGVAGNAGTAQGGAAAHAGQHPNGGGCAVTPRQAPGRAALPAAFLLIALAGWRRSRRANARPGPQGE